VQTPRSIRRLRVLFWLLAVIITLASAVYQRVTGPTYPLEGEIFIAGQTVHYEIPRNEETTGDALVSIAVPATVTGAVFWKRYKTDDALTETPMVRDAEGLSAHLPVQPPAGKLRYHLVLDDGEHKVKLPEDGATVVRFKDPVPLWAIVPHVLFMFLAMLLAARTGLEAIRPTGQLRCHAWWTFGFLFAGGFVFGPIVQQYAFGQAWTGFPYGCDLTDNKVLIAFIAYAVALIVLGVRRPIRARERWAAVIATIVMLGIFMIPHSMYGSELDYSKLESGVSVTEAIGQG